jgi:signal transduction histidine kinase
VQTEIDDRAEVFGDPERLKQAIRNLVRNAVQASGGPEGVRVVVTRSDGVHVVRVHDVGRGMPPEAVVRAFEHGFSGATGVGVGLSVAKDIIERHGGSVRVAASSTVGTIMEAAFPGVDARLTEEEDVRVVVSGTAGGTVD